MDRTESKNLAATHPEEVKEPAALYDAWARRANVVPPEQLPRAPDHSGAKPRRQTDGSFELSNGAD